VDVWQRAGAYLRVHGADTPHGASPQPSSGSSLRVWGRSAEGEPVATRTGLISACAGPTFAHFISVLRVRAHLRVRGADLTMRMPNSVPAGSSPRARGRRSPQPQRAVTPGLISACVGPTWTRAHGVDPVGAHLRVRGADGAVAAGRGCGPGSSPRARGRPTSGMRTSIPRGLISACAGPTTRGRRRCEGAWAHLRVRGADPCGVLCFRAF